MLYEWCGECMKPIIADPDSDLLDILSKDQACQCGGDDE